jgi:hypothetical protein
MQAVVPPPDGAYPGANTAEGQNALFSLTSGVFNTAIGFSSLRSNTTGQFNTAVGGGALFANTAERNTATGAGALLFHATGNSNTANGALALLHDLSGQANTATGAGALFNNNDGSFNVANGLNTLASNTAGDENTAVGANALFSNTGGNNTASGSKALLGNTTGHDNTAVGRSALLDNTTGNGNIAVGADAGSSLTSGDNNIDIGNTGVIAESDTIRIGDSQTKAFIAGIRGVTVSNTLPVLVDASGQLGTMSSSRRFKQEIKPMDKASEAILGLKPVTFHYKSDNTAAPQFGLIAEEVAKVAPDLVVRDEDGEIYTVRYDAVNAMLLNEFLKAHRHVQEQDAIIARQQKQIDALTAGLQKVSARLETSQPAPQTVLNNQN